MSRDFDWIVLLYGTKTYVEKRRDDSCVMDSTEYHQFKISSDVKEMTPSSTYPIVVSILVLLVALTFISYIHAGVKFKWVFFIFVLLLINLYYWWKTLFEEFFVANFMRWSTGVVVNYRNPTQFYVEYVKATRVAMFLFIASEVMFFFSFFWAFFHSLGSPAIQIGGIWPPYGLAHVLPDPFVIPLTNTLILLTSGLTLTWAHHAKLLSFRLDLYSTKEYYKEFDIALGLTILLALNFLFWQLFEFITNDLQLSDGIFGSTFYMLTGFHGFHVVIGTIFLSVFYFSNGGSDDVSEVLRQTRFMNFTNDLSLTEKELQGKLREIWVKHKKTFVGQEEYTPKRDNLTNMLRNLILGRFNIKAYSTVFQYHLRNPSTGFDCAVWYWHFVDVVWLFLFILVYLPDQFLV